MRNRRGNSSRPRSRCVRRTRSHVECRLSHQLMAQHTTQPEGTASPVPLPQQKTNQKSPVPERDSGAHETGTGTNERARQNEAPCSEQHRLLIPAVHFPGFTPSCRFSGAGGEGIVFFFHCGGGTRRARVPAGPTARGHPTTTGAPRVLPREASRARGAAAMSPTASYIWYVSG